METALSTLKSAGLKLTPQRIAIVRELEDDLTHPTAQELFERLRPAFPTMSFATVYNTLDALSKLGLITPMRVGGKDGATTRFDPNTSPHHHAVCDACGKVVDLPIAPDASTPSAINEIQMTSGFAVRVEERTYRGLCAGCVRSSSQQVRSSH